MEYKASRLVRALDAASGQRAGFGEGGLTEVVSARSALQALHLPAIAGPARGFFTWPSVFSASKEASEALEAQISQFSSTALSWSTRD